MGGKSRKTCGVSKKFLARLRSHQLRELRESQPPGKKIEKSEKPNVRLFQEPQIQYRKRRR
jgi:hypothetical protein